MKDKSILIASHHIPYYLCIEKILKDKQNETRNRICNRRLCHHFTMGRLCPRGKDMDIERLHPLCFGTEHPTATEQALTGRKQSGCKDCQSSTLPQLIVQHRTQHDEPSLSGDQQHGQRNWNYQQFQQDLLHRQLWSQCPMDRVEWRTASEHHQATEAE